MRDVIEQLEPGLHQFQPVEIIWKKDGSHAADFFWFNPCNRTDGIDRTHSTAGYNEKIGKWKYEGGEFVVSLAQTAGCHIWIDPRTSFNLVWVSEVFKQTIENVGITGVGFSEYKVV
ncbi:MAG: hypothetical protein GY742_19855 [Hyphomicrobiales bacterium]|nr:hypothetical protein [Hyphomicrobiales bacterium]